MQEQIEAMAKDLGIAFQLAGTTRFGAVAEILVNTGWHKQSEWISVEDRLPTKEDADKYEHVLAITRDGRVRDWWYELVIFSSKNFTHWMPLPEPPEMKGGE